jgi:hypothetical protein
MPLNFQTFRRPFLVALAALALQSVCGPAAAAWIPFDPPAGSWWIVETETRTDDTVANRTALIKSRAEITVDGKSADGFKVTYMLRSAAAEGNDPSLPLLRAAMQSLTDIPIQATTNERGRPVRVDNLEEVEAAIRGRVDKETTDLVDKPQVVAVLHRMLVRVADANAVNYLDALPELARAPDDGAKAGEVKLDSGFGLGLGLKDVLKVAAQSPGKKLLSAIGSAMTPMQLYTALSEMEFSFHMHSQTTNKDEVLITMTQNTETKAHAFSYDLQRTENKSIIVTPVPVP